jgi:hypothetical protein
MIPDDEMSRQESTAATMHTTAEQLEAAEGILHHSAEASPNDKTKARLHRLGEDVTALAHDIDQRADRLSSPTGRADHLEHGAAASDKRPLQ